MSLFKCCSCKGSGSVLEQAVVDPYKEEEDEERRIRMQAGGRGDNEHGRYNGKEDEDIYSGDKDETLSLATSNEDGTLYRGDGGSIDGDESNDLRQVSLGTRLRRQSWALGQRSIMPFVVQDLNGDIEDHVQVLDGDDLSVSPKSSPLLLERCFALYDPRASSSSIQLSSLSSGEAAALSLSETELTATEEFSNEWSSSSSGPGALRLINLSARRAAFQVRFIDAESNDDLKRRNVIRKDSVRTNSSVTKDVLATPDSGILESGADIAVEVLLGVVGNIDEEQAGSMDMTVRDDRLLITALWFDDDVDLESVSPQELDAALERLWKEKLGSSKRYRVRLSLAQPEVVQSQEGESDKTFDASAPVVEGKSTHAVVSDRNFMEGDASSGGDAGGNDKPASEDGSECLDGLAMHDEQNGENEGRKELGSDSNNVRKCGQNESAENSQNSKENGIGTNTPVGSPADLTVSNDSASALDDTKQNETTVKNGDEGKHEDAINSADSGGSATSSTASALSVSTTTSLVPTKVHAVPEDGPKSSGRSKMNLKTAVSRIKQRRKTAAFIRSRFGTASVSGSLLGSSETRKHSTSSQPTSSKRSSNIFTRAGLKAPIASQWQRMSSTHRKNNLAQEDTLHVPSSISNLLPSLQEDSTGDSQRLISVSDKDRNGHDLKRDMKIVKRAPDDPWQNNSNRNMHSDDMKQNDGRLLSSNNLSRSQSSSLAFLGMDWILEENENESHPRTSTSSRSSIASSRPSIWSSIFIEDAEQASKQINKSEMSPASYKRFDSTGSNFDDGSNFDCELGLGREACNIASAALQQEVVEYIPLQALSNDGDPLAGLSSPSPLVRAAYLMNQTQQYHKKSRPSNSWRSCLVLAAGRCKNGPADESASNLERHSTPWNSSWVAIPPNEMFIQRCLWILERSHYLSATSLGTKIDKSRRVETSSASENSTMFAASPKPWFEGRSSSIRPGQAEYISFEGLGLDVPQPWQSHLLKRKSRDGGPLYELTGFTVLWARCRDFLHANASRRLMKKSNRVLNRVDNISGRFTHSSSASALPKGHQESFSQVAVEAEGLASYLHLPIYLLAPRDHDYRLDSPMAMRTEASTISPGPLSRFILGAYGAVAMLSTRRDLVNKMFLDPRPAKAKFCATKHYSSTTNTLNATHNINIPEDCNPASSSFRFPYMCSGANVVRVFTPGGGARLLSVDDCVPYFPASEEVIKDGKLNHVGGEHVFGEERGTTEAWVPLVLKALLKLTAGGNRVDNQMSAAASNADQKDTDVKEAIENSYGSTVTNKKVEPEPCCIMSQAQILSTISIEQAFAALTGSRLTRLHIKSELVRRKQQQLAREKKISSIESNPLSTKQVYNVPEVLSRSGLLNRAWKRMQHAMADGDIVGLSVLKEYGQNSEKNDAEAGDQFMKGLVPGFTYTVLDAREIACFHSESSEKSDNSVLGKSTRRMLLLHNPWRPKYAKDLPYSQEDSNKRKKRGSKGSRGHFWPMWSGKWSLTDRNAAFETWEKHPEAQSTLLPVSRVCRRDSFWVEWDHFAPQYVDYVLFAHCLAAKGIQSNAVRAREIRNNNRMQFQDRNKNIEKQLHSDTDAKPRSSHSRVHSAEVPARPSIDELHSLQYRQSMKREQMFSAADHSHAGWQKRSIQGRWVRGSTAGGSCDFATWRDNPQIFVDAPQRATKALITLRLLQSKQPRPFLISGTKYIDQETEQVNIGESSPSPFGIALYVFPARTDGLPIVFPRTVVNQKLSELTTSSPFSTERLSQNNYGFNRVIHSTEVTLELDLGPAIGPLILIPTTQLPGIAGRFEIEVLFDGAGTDLHQVILHNLENLPSSLTVSPKANLTEGVVAGATSETKIKNLEKKHWFHYVHRGAWFPGRSAGGCRLSSSFGENAAFLAELKNAHAITPDQLEIYAVLSFNRCPEDSEKQLNSAGANKSIKPLVAGCHCFSMPQLAEGSSSHESTAEQVIDPSELAKGGDTAFEVFNMFGENRMLLSTPFQYLRPNTGLSVSIERGNETRSSKKSEDKGIAFERSVSYE